ncbi:hypothetical protein [Aliidiomarina indica]|uniref:hypothetical protein n=1 Tax=Aliidiomarina indica TaxID=2749147 RepID=UPI00188FCFDD|nr:hypothetical protein [Aliidiomarina indica]
MARVSFPWIRPLWQQLSEASLAGTLAHGVGIEFQPELGSEQLLEQLSRLLLCQQPIKDSKAIRACGQCKQCLLYKAGTHPDILRVAPEPGKQLGVDAIRKVGAFVQQRSAQGGNKVIQVLQADAMTLAAANSLLKTLEEPPADTFLIVSAAQFSLLLPTVRSRLMMFPMPRPDTAMLRTWFAELAPESELTSAMLNYAQKRPLTALQLLREHQPLPQAMLDDLLCGTVQLPKDADAIAQLVKTILESLHLILRDYYERNALPEWATRFQSLPKERFAQAISDCYQAGIHLRNDLQGPGLNANLLTQRWLHDCRSQLTC